MKSSLPEATADQIGPAHIGSQPLLLQGLEGVLGPEPEM